MHANLALDGSVSWAKTPRVYLDRNHYWVEMMGRLRPGVSLAQAQTATESSTAATAPATTTPPPTATATPSSACAGLSGAARSDCENSENAQHALCFGMSDKVRADCVKSYYPNKPQAQPTKADSGQSSASGSDTGAAASSSSGASGAPK